MERDFSEVKLLGFDVFGTVVDWRSGVARAVAPFLEARHIAIPPEEFADRWRALYEPAMESVRSGKRPWVPLNELNLENLVAALAEVGLDVAALPMEELEEINKAWERLDPWPDSIEGLTRLKSKYKLAPISNGDIGGMTNLARFAWLPWDMILGAEVTRTYKPQIATYIGSARKAGLEPGQVAMVAAHNYDLAAARRAGLKTVFITRATEHGPGQKTDLQADSDWHVVGNDLVAVAQALGC